MAKKKKSSIIISLPEGKCLIWDKGKQDWKIKQNYVFLKEKDKIKIKRIDICWCGSSLWIREDKNNNYIIAEFKNKHKFCGIKNKKRIDKFTTFEIKEEIL